ncbi:MULTISPECIES: hypothetical protein [Pseudanabaena]|uniref:hypothetical protein n=1 Tax=Pseudanabaena TaxID=1152 RepID=UPI00247872CD|nr:MULTISPECIES: hypothetical protein [Pseudanabaena]MEA5486023.1 hypothetical protein [Pseudanabaena sp. CCNP1317]WGS73024.1 hypothetical protein OA858_03070 [Pseudanabaena galeata CCNP1313]
MVFNWGELLNSKDDLATAIAKFLTKYSDAISDAIMPFLLIALCIYILYRCEARLLLFCLLDNVSSTKAKNGKNRLAILTIFRHLRRAKHAANGYIELTLDRVRYANPI